VVLTPLSGDAAVILNLSDGKPLNLIQLSEDEVTGTGAVLSQSLILLTTRRGLAAFGRPPVVSAERAP
jgi:hypothetical protein